MQDCLLAVDVFSDFAHEDGDVLLAALRPRGPALEQALRQARADRLPVLFGNDTQGVWDGDARGLVERALAGPGGEVLRPLAPVEGEAFLVKPR